MSKKYLTLVFAYETDKELHALRAISMQDNCIAWSMDHEILRGELVQQAVEDKDLKMADRYIHFDGIKKLRDELRT